ncbi:MAG TPA: CmcI family methyltransferase [Verrucomicrobiota bacterium]|nr:hydroxylase [Verrucomicrobiales bacterium]HRI12256.1 CmcI family methyltransferase [Verrucomicrobiota bacterium]
MRLVIDTDHSSLTCEHDDRTEKVPLYSDRAFELISEQWLKVGWNQRYPYTFSWFGRPIIQLPEDMVRVQEVIYRLHPDVILETGVAHGGSLIYYASLCQALGQGRVIGIDIEIRPANRLAIQQHPLASRIELIEGSSVDPFIVDAARYLIKPGESVLVLLDSNHSRDHVAAELEAYHSLVTENSYLVATDGIMKDLADVPRGDSSWEDDNPVSAVNEFLERHPEFILEQPAWPFNESTLQKNLTHWPSAWLRRIR